MQESNTKLPPLMLNVNLKEVLKLGLDLNHIYLLERFERGQTIQLEEKTAGWVQGLVRKGYLLRDFKVTAFGTKLLDKLRKNMDSVFLDIKIAQNEVLDDFEKWWKAFPGTDTVVVNGTTLFKGSRGMRVNKPKCKIEFDRIIREGEFTAQELIDAVTLEVQQRVAESAKKRENTLKYMHNSLTYLHKADYDGFVEMSKLLKKSPKETNSVPAGTFSI